MVCKKDLAGNQGWILLKQRRLYLPLSHEFICRLCKISKPGNSGEIVVRWENTKKGAPAVLRPLVFASPGSVRDSLHSSCCQPPFCALEVMKESCYFSDHDHCVQSRGRTKMGSHWKANVGHRAMALMTILLWRMNWGFIAGSWKRAVAELLWKPEET